MMSEQHHWLHQKRCLQCTKSAWHANMTGLRLSAGDFTAFSVLSITCICLLLLQLFEVSHNQNHSFWLFYLIVTMWSQMEKQVSEITTKKHKEAHKERKEKREEWKKWKIGVCTSKTPSWILDITILVILTLTLKVFVEYQWLISPNPPSILACHL